MLSGGASPEHLRVSSRAVAAALPSATAVELRGQGHSALATAPGAVAATKALLARARFEPPAALVQEAAAVFSRAVQGPEGIEGTMAFLQKRKASWVPASADPT